jgi:hypothetical protein
VIMGESQRLQIPLDIHLYEGVDDDIIEVLQKVPKKFRVTAVLGLAEYGRRMGGLGIAELTTGEVTGRSPGMRFRAPLRYTAYPELALLWDRSPHGNGRTLFAALVRRALRAMKGGADLPLDMLLPRGGPHEEIRIEPPTGAEPLEEADKTPPAAFTSLLQSIDLS